MSAKELAKNVIEQLPDTVSWEDLNEELYAAAVREGLEQLNRGEAISHEEVKRQFQSWFSR